MRSREQFTMTYGTEPNWGSLMEESISFEIPTVTDHGSIADHTFAQASNRRLRRLRRRLLRRRRRLRQRFGEHPAAS